MVNALYLGEVKIFLTLFFILCLQSCNFLSGFNKEIKENDIVSENTEIKINLPQGWEINEKAPSFLELKSEEGESIKKWDAHSLRNEKQFIPAQETTLLLLKSKLFYCEKEKPEICIMKDIEKKLRF